MQLLPHAPYSPDRALSLRLIPNPEVKKQVKGTLFESAEDACRAFTRAVEDLPRSAWDGEWNEWFYREVLCIAAEGSLFLLLLKKCFLLLKKIKSNLVSQISTENPDIKIFCSTPSRVLRLLKELVFVVVASLTCTLPEFGFVYSSCQVP